jgi:hypothetical protein
MELFLNILWVLIAIGALGVWRIHWKREECSGKVKPLQEWTAFACALVFIFFAVSLSDDLHAAVILSDDSSGGRHPLLVWDCAHAKHPSAAKEHARPGTAPPGTAHPAPLQITALTAPAMIHLCPYLEADIRAGRSPPPLLQANH